MEIIVAIASNCSGKLTVAEKDGWIVVTAPVKEGRYGYKALYGLRELTDHRWNDVPSTLKVHLNGFEFDGACFDWMINYFGKENFKLSSPC